MKVYHSIIRDLLLILFVIYFAQGSLYSSGSIISQSVLFTVFIFSSYYFLLLLIIEKKNFFFRTWTAFMLLNVFGFVLTASISSSQQFAMLKRLLMFLLPFYPFYYFSIKNYLNSKHLMRFFVFMLPVFIIQFYTSTARTLAERDISEDSLVNNVSYSFVGLLPFIFLFKKRKILSYFLMMVLIIFIIQGTKRGAIISGAIGLIIFIYYQLKTIERKYKLRGYIIVAIATTALVYYSYDLFQNNEYLIYRMQKLSEEDGSSGRNVIYSTLFNTWYNSEDILNVLFGFGFASSLQIAGNFAHNDWLELLTSFGFLGVFIYSILFYALFKYIFNNKWEIDKKLLLFTVVLLWLFASIVSMGFTSRSGLIQAILIAYLVGSKSNRIE